LIVTAAGRGEETGKGISQPTTQPKYSTVTEASPATITRDLADLTEKGALIIREGERRHARYKLNVRGTCRKFLSMTAASW
jgi:Fic family protein